MRQNLLIIAFLLVIQSAFSQTDKKVESNLLANTKQTVSIDPVYFVLGTLSDYNGHFYYVKREKQIDRYFPFEKPMVNYLTLYIKAELNITVDIIFEKSNHSEMYSDELSKKKNSFYGEKEELLSNKFETKNQIYSFLAGAYYRYGEKLDSAIYKIQLTNSPNHHICYELLKKIGCENVLYEYLKNIPAQFIYYFEPTDELKKYFDSIEFEKEILKKSFYNEIEEMMKGVITKEDMEKSFQESKDKEIAKFKITYKK
ncbi:hypothetical protein [Flavobacterium cellulosilyticum]|uniref:Uncharacterized protein n=1 Tax=Flavobacterium cellulosilyticum TaxID=2541731 RepID=A0A4R5CM08_9FLAO|nr:hypothetical protein [Flavobacterium cellulosilyticum]TDD98532.1 hypothetical protein E0F76_05225 [Flavobacterium cellulosilyticum]